MNESESTILIKEVSSVNGHNEAINQIPILPSGNKNHYLMIVQ